MKINTLKLALASGLVSALAIALLTLDALYLGRGVTAVRTLGPVFPGYVVSWQGLGIGALYGFATFFVYGGILGWLYNNMPELKGRKKAKAGKGKKKK